MVRNSSDVRPCVKRLSRRAEMHLFAVQMRRIQVPGTGMPLKGAFDTLFSGVPWRRLRSVKGQFRYGQRQKLANLS